MPEEHRIAGGQHGTGPGFARGFADGAAGCGTEVQPGRNAIATIKEAGGTPLLCVVIVNKTAEDAVAGVPLRGLIRARAL